MEYRTDEAGRTFVLSDDGKRAIFPVHDESVPKNHRPASNREIAAYEADREYLWDLIMSCERMMYKIGNKFGLDNNTAQYLGFAVLMRCAKLYDGSVKFSTYAYRSLYNELAKYAYHCYKHRTITVSDWCDTPFELAELDKQIIELEDTEELQYLIERLPTYSRTLLELRYVHGQTFSAIGTQLGVCQNTVRGHLAIAHVEARRLIRTINVKQ